MAMFLRFFVSCVRACEMEQVVSELFPVYQFNYEHHNLHAIAMNINAQSVAATRFAIAFIAFSDFAARLKSNSSKFIATPTCTGRKSFRSG